MTHSPQRNAYGQGLELVAPQPTCKSPAGSRPSAPADSRHKNPAGHPQPSCLTHTHTHTPQPPPPAQWPQIQLGGGVIKQTTAPAPCPLRVTQSRTERSSCASCIRAFQNLVNAEIKKSSQRTATFRQRVGALLAHGTPALTCSSRPAARRRAQRRYSR